MAKYERQTISEASIGIVAGVAFIILLAFISSSGSQIKQTTCGIQESCGNNPTITMRNASHFYQIIRSNVTVYGQAAGAPCDALHLACTSSAGQLITAQLIECNGSYYYLSQTSLLNNSIWYDYTVWYTNSTVYCISPTLPWAIVCPADVYSGSVSSVITGSDTLFTACHITGQGWLLFRVISDSTGMPVRGEKTHAVLTTSCINGQYQNQSTSETQVLYIDNFTQTQEGWLTPVLPNGAEVFGVFNFSVQYMGKTYHFSVMIHPASEACVTLKVPSGNVNAPSYYLSGCPAQ